MDLTRKELLLMTGRADAYSDELFDTKRKLSQTVEAKAFLQEEIGAAEQRLAESRNQVMIIFSNNFCLYSNKVLHSQCNFTF